jgi:hypothetical protein
MDPSFLTGLPVATSIVGVAAILFLLVASGRLASPREVRDMSATIAWQRKRIEELHDQKTAMLREMTATQLAFLADIRDAGQKSRGA